ncbi:hypothetical protein [Legionella sp. WA2022007384]
MPTSLKLKELSQWTHGEPDLMGRLLFNLFIFLKEATNKGKDSPQYLKIMDNIANFISLLGPQRLHIHQQDKPAIDASALLGAYLRLGIKHNDKPIVELDNEQIAVVHAFVKPLIHEAFTPEQFFASIEGTPSQKHKAILKMFIFKGISAEEQKEMFKGKYEDKVHELLDSILNLADFMRTPFRVLPEEEKAAIAQAKKTGKGQAQTSGIDLQWTSMHKAIEQSLENIIALKMKKSSPLKKNKAEEAQKALQQIKQSLGQCQKCFGVANAIYETQKEFAVEARRLEEVHSETFKTLGFPEANQEKINKYISDFREILIKIDPENAKAIQAMTLTQLIKLYGDQSNASFEKKRKELASTQEELQKTSELVKQKTDALQESHSQLQTLQQEYEHLKLQIDEATQKLEQQGIELTRLQKVESAAKQTIEQQKNELQQTRSALEELKIQLQRVQKEKEELRILASGKEDEKTIFQLRKRLEELQLENNELNQQLKEKQTAKSSSEESPEINPLQTKLDSLQREYESLLERVEKGKKIQEPVSEAPQDMTQLKVQLKTLVQENALLNESLIKLRNQLKEANALKQPVEVPADNIKPDLLIALGGLRLNKADTSKIKQKIINCNDQIGLLEIAAEIQRLEKINQFIETMNNGILQRAGFFSSDPHKKIQTIETTFQQLSIEDKKKLAGLSEKEMNDELSKEKGKESDIGKFLKAIHHKRGFIAIRSATSFTFFKTEISHLKDELEHINAPASVL